MAFFQVFGPKTLLHSWFFSFSLLQYKSWSLFITCVTSTPVQSIILSCLNHCDCLIIGLHASATVALVSHLLKFKSYHTTPLHTNPPKIPIQSGLKSKSSQWPYITLLFLFPKYTKTVSASGHLHVLLSFAWIILPGSGLQISAQKSQYQRLPLTTLHSITLTCSMCFIAPIITWHNLCHTRM